MNKTLLVAALALVSGSAFAQMTAVEDEALSSVTGQEGISIALTIKTHIDDIVWGDADGMGGAGAAGTLHLSDVAIGSGDLVTRAAAIAADGKLMYAGGGKEYQNPVIFLSPIKIDVANLSDVKFGVVQPAGLVGAPITGVPNVPGTTVAGKTYASYSDFMDTMYAAAGGTGANPDTTGTDGLIAQAIVIEMPRAIANFRIGSIKAGNNGKSIGSLEMKGIDMAGTKVAIWGH